MISEDTLAQEYIRVISEYYPKVGEVLDGCYVKVVTNYWGKPCKSFQHIVIYCPEEIISYVESHKHKLTDVAENMGLIQVVFRNASRLLKDPMSKIKQSDPRMWLDLQWISF